MEVIGLLNGGAPVLKKYQVAATLTNIGVPHLISAGNTGGLAVATTTGAADMVGVNLDTVTYTTTQGTGASSAERLATFVINPDAILRARISGSATEGTALSLHTVTTASAGGTAVTTAAEWSSPTFDEGVVWSYDGANAGQKRKITSVSSTAGTVTIPFDYATVVGDRFLRAPYWPMASTTVQLTTNLYEADGSIAVGTGAPFLVIDFELRDAGDAGTLRSYIHMIAGDHFLARLS